MDIKYAQGFPTDFKPIKHILIGGMPGTGKTVSAATAPNITWLALETGIFQQADIIKQVHNIDIRDASKFKVVPFYKYDFYTKYLKDERIEPQHPKNNQSVWNIHDPVLHWVKTYAKDIPNDGTLVMDSWSALQEKFDEFYEHHPKMTKTGDIDDYYFWERKIVYAEALSSALESLDCNVIVLCHEAQERDKVSGKLLDKLQPLMQGKFVAKMKRYYSYCIRSMVVERKDAKGNPIINSTTQRVEVDYMWQVSSDAKFDAKCATPNLPMLVPAKWSSLK
jgi:hypothetical protein